LGADIRREALNVLNPPNPTGSFAFTTTGTNSSTVPGSGNALASLLLGQVNAFTIDIQKQVIQPRAHIAEFFVGDDWKVSPRLTVNIGARYTLNFPSTEKRDQGLSSISIRRSGFSPHRPRAGMFVTSALAQAWRIGLAIAGCFVPATA